MDEQYDTAKAAEARSLNRIVACKADRANLDEKIVQEEANLDEIRSDLVELAKQCTEQYAQPAEAVDMEDAAESAEAAPAAAAAGAGRTPERNAHGGGDDSWDSWHSWSASAADSRVDALQLQMSQQATAMQTLQEHVAMVASQLSVLIPQHQPQQQQPVLQAQAHLAQQVQYAQQHLQQQTVPHLEHPVQQVNHTAHASMAEAQQAEHALAYGGAAPSQPTPSQPAAAHDPYLVGQATWETRISTMHGVRPGHPSLRRTRILLEDAL